jgi:hypothetical protein
MTSEDMGYGELCFILKLFRKVPQQFFLKGSADWNKEPRSSPALYTRSHSSLPEKISPTLWLNPGEAKFARHRSAEGQEEAW